MRRRAIGLVLVGLGAFLLAAALLVRLVLVDTLVRLPLDQTAEPTAKGTDVDFFDTSELRQLTGLEADVQQRVQGDPDSPDANDDVAVWHFGSVITDEDGVVLNAGTYTVCIDRHEAVAVDCESDDIDDDTSRSVEGLTLTFPFGTEQQDYEVFNSTTGQAWPAVFDGTEELEGLEVYRFVVTIPETVIRTAEVPGALVDADDDVVEADVVYSNVRTIWVEPTSGVIVTSEEQPLTVLRGPDGQEGPTVLAGTFAGDSSTIAAGVERAEDTASKINLVSTVLPLVLLGLGIVCVAFGIVLALRGARRDDDRQEYRPQSEPAPVR